MDGVGDCVGFFEEGEGGEERAGDREAGDGVVGERGGGVDAELISRQREHIGAMVVVSVRGGVVGVRE